VKNFLRAGCFVLILMSFVALAQPSTQTQAESWQRLEYVCANNVVLSQLSVAPGQVTLIFENTFYPMKQVASEDAVTLRFESVTPSDLLWLIKNDEGQLLQNGKVLADQCKTQINTTPQTVLYQCQDEITVSVHYINDTAFIDVRDPTYGDQRYELPRTSSETGSRFSNGMTTWFVLGEEANLYEEAEEVQHAEKCKLQN
jgi:membrane-bound inhibitor of C-type lysozyme